MRRLQTRRDWYGCLAAVFAALAFVAAAGCSLFSGKRAPQATGAPGSTLRIGMAANYPPLAFKEDGKLTGAEVDFAHMLARDLDVKVELVQTPWNDLIPDLVDDKIDVIMSGLSITPERQKLVSFADSYGTIGQMALFRVGDYERLRDEGARNSPATRIGAVGGTTGEQYVRSHYPLAQITTFASVDDGVAALRNGQIDVFVHDAPAIWRVTSPRGAVERELASRYIPLTNEKLAWAVRKQDDQLLLRLNAVLAKWKADGQLDLVGARWVPVRKVAAAPGADRQY
jgi:ABC-type amino acid transport substrate-binding protein